MTQTAHEATREYRRRARDKLADSSVGLRGGERPTQLAVRESPERIVEKREMARLQQERLAVVRQAIRDVVESRVTVAKTLKLVAENLHELASFPTGEDSYEDGGHLTIIKPVNTKVHTMIAGAMVQILHAGNMLIEAASDGASEPVELPDDLTDAQLEEIRIGSPEGARIIETFGVVRKVSDALGGKGAVGDLVEDDGNDE